MTLSHYIQSEAISPRNNASFNSHKIHSIGSKAQISTVSKTQTFHQGVSLTLNHRLSGKDTGLDLDGVSYSRWDITYKHFHPIIPKHTLAFRLMYGKFHTHTASQKTFESEGFLIGGSTTLRGYNENYLYGRQRLLSNIEYRWVENPYREWVFFTDFGISDEHINIFKTSYESGFGIGIRLDTPVAPIRLDVSKGKQWMIHFNIGQLF